MEPPELYIPPCCIDRQLPGLIRASRPVSIFYSQGDWGWPKLTHAVEPLVDSTDRDVVTILVMSDIAASTVEQLRREYRMGWSKAVVIVTASDRTEYLRNRLDDAHLDSLWYCPGQVAAIRNNLWLRYAPDNYLLITGPLSPNADGFIERRVCAYTALYKEPPTDGSSADSPAAASIVPPLPLQQAFAPYRSMLRLHATIKGSNPLFNPWLK